MCSEKLLTFLSKPAFSHSSFSVNVYFHLSVTQVKNVGLICHSLLSLTFHIQSVLKSCQQSCNNMLSIWPLSSPQVYHPSPNRLLSFLDHRISSPLASPLALPSLFSTYYLGGYFKNLRLYSCWKSLWDVPSHLPQNARAFMIWPPRLESLISSLAHWLLFPLQSGHNGLLTWNMPSTQCSTSWNTLALRTHVTPRSLYLSAPISLYQKVFADLDKMLPPAESRPFFVFVYCVPPLPTHGRHLVNICVW